MESDIKILCHCIEILVGVDNDKHGISLARSATEVDVFLAHLKNNTSLVLSEVKANPKLQQLLKPYENYMILENVESVQWNFVTCCLILITILHDSVSSKTADIEDKTQTHVGSVLSILQQKAIEKCLQFIIALGILPNLLPGLGISLQNRSQFGVIVDHIGRDLCPRTKYKHLVICLTVLLRCTSHVVLQSIIIRRHAGDLLAALFQLCYAPIKKLNEDEFCSTSKDRLLHFGGGQKKDVGPDKNTFDLPDHLVDMLEDAKEGVQWTENQLISEMWKDRQNFQPHLEHLLQKICPEVLIWELFLLYGMDVKLVKTKRTKTPSWLKNICSQMLADRLLKPQGLKLFIRVMLDKVTDSDLKDSSVDKRRIEAIARLISDNRFHSIPFENYVKNISSQVIDLLNSRKSQVDSVFAYVASFIVLQLVEVDKLITEKYIFKQIFKELWICLDRTEISRCTEGCCLIEEQALTTCIVNTYKVFVESGVLTEHIAFDLLLPFYHLIFIMFAETQNGVSFLGPKLKGILVSILKRHKSDDALMFLKLASFEDVTLYNILYATDLKCVFGDSGGIVVIKNSNSSPEEVLENINKKCAAVIALIDEVGNRKLKVSYFLFLLKKLNDLSVSNEFTDEDYEGRHMKDSLTLLQQLQQIAEIIGEDLIEDIVEAMHFIKVTLEKAVVVQNSEHQYLLFGPETIVTSLLIFSTIIEYKDQLSPTQWKAMKECLPSLQKLAPNLSDAILKTMCENIIFAIATHGAAVVINKTEESFNQKSNSQNISHSEDVLNRKEPHSPKIPNPVSQGEKQKVTVGSNCSVEVMPSDSSLNQKCSHQLIEKDSIRSSPNETSSHEHTEKTVSDLLSGDNSNINNDSRYESALKDLNDPFLPVRGHGLIALTHLITENNKEALAHKENLLKIFLENLSDEDSYIYLLCIQGLSALAHVSTGLVLPAVLKRFCDANDDICEVQLKLGEVLMKICKNLGKMTVKYRYEFIHAYLCGARHSQPEVRASSLSNIGEVCKHLKFSLGPFLQEILLCVLSLLKTDDDVEVRRSAVLVITLLLQGTGKDAFVVLESEMKELYNVLKHVYYYEKDDVLKLHAQLALEEINAIVTNVFCGRPVLTKEIRILDPF